MSWSGGGAFSRTKDWTDDRDLGTKILATRHDENDDELATGIGACLTKNNESKPTADFAPNTDATYSVGTSALRWLTAWVQSLKIKTSTFTGTLSSTNLTANRALELPDVAGTLAVASQAGWALLTSTAASASATIDFTASLDDTYDKYMIAFDAVKPATDDVYLTLRVGTGAGPTYQSSGYSYSGNMSGPAGTASTGSTTDSITTAIVLTRPGTGQGIGSDTGEHAQGFVFFDNPDASNFPVFGYQSHYMRSDAVACDVRGTGNYTSATAITGVRFLMSSGNITSGNFRLYGLRKS